MKQEKLEHTTENFAKLTVENPEGANDVWKAVSLALQETEGIEDEDKIREIAEKIITKKLKNNKQAIAFVTTILTKMK